jgi:DNA-binding transcriptional MerR regulator
MSFDQPRSEIIDLEPKSEEKRSSEVSNPSDLASFIKTLQEAGFSKQEMVELVKKREEEDTKRQGKKVDAEEDTKRQGKKVDAEEETKRKKVEAEEETKRKKEEEETKRQIELKKLESGSIFKEVGKLIVFILFRN